MDESPSAAATLPVPAPAPGPDSDTEASISDEIEGWLEGAGSKSLGSLIEVFEKKSFAILFVLLLGVPAQESRPTAG